MKRSAVNRAYHQALACFTRHHWALPPAPEWDITDFGLRNFDRYGLALITLADEPEYCEKLMFAHRGQETPCHSHERKKEDIICRAGELTLKLWPARPVAGVALAPSFEIRINGDAAEAPTGTKLVLPAGSRVTLVPGVWHAFWPSSADCIIGEVSTANDDTGDNIFLDPTAGRFPVIEEDEPAAVRLVRD